MSDRDREFLEYYKRHRIEDQIDYYHRSYRKNARHVNQLVVISGVLLFVSSFSSLAASEGLLGLQALWTAAGTIIPSIAGGIVAVRALYEHERNSTRYRNTYYDLRNTALDLRPAKELRDDELRTATTQYVFEIENLLSRENRQWVQMRVERSPTRQSENRP